MSENLNVIGLDLSITATGVADFDGALRTIKTKSAGDRRLDEIAAAVETAARWGGLTLAVLEDLPIHAHASGITGMVQGVVRLALHREGVPYVVMAPASLKKYATGRGNATKADMRVALLQRTGLDVRDDNQVDAYWLRAAGLDHLGHPPVKLPAAQRAALAAVAWPAT